MLGWRAQVTGSGVWLSRRLAITEIGRDQIIMSCLLDKKLELNSARVMLDSSTLTSSLDKFTCWCTYTYIFVCRIRFIWQVHLNLNFSLTLHLINHIKNILGTISKYTLTTDSFIGLFKYSTALLHSFLIPVLRFAAEFLFWFSHYKTHSVCFLQILLPAPCRVLPPICLQGNHSKIGVLFIFKVLKLTFFSVLEPVKIKSAEGLPLL